MNKLKVLVIVTYVSTFQLSAQQKTKPYIYGGDSNYPPYEYLNIDGNPEGFNIDIMNAIAEEMQIQVKFELKEWSIIRMELEKTQNIDISDMFYSKERDSIVDYSIPFTIAYDEIFIRVNTTGINSLADIIGKKVIVQNMSFIYDKLISNYPLAKLITVENEPEALLLLSQGVGDCAILSQTVTRTVIKVKNYSNIKRVGAPIFPKEYAFVVKEGNSELLRIINNGLVKIKNKKILDKIEDKWFGQKEEYKNIRIFLTYAILVIVFFTIIIVTVIGWNRSLKRQVLLKTANLIDTHKKLTDTLENMDEGFYWVAKDWSITNVNKQAAALFQRNQREIINKNILEEFPLVKKYIFDAYVKAFETQKGIDIEFYVEPIQKWFENRIIPSGNGLAVFAKDITEKKKSEVMLKESESNLKSLIENWTESIWAIDNEYKYIIFNDYYMKIFFDICSLPLQKGMNALEFLPNDKKEFWKNNYDLALLGKRLTSEISIEQNKSVKYFEIFLNPIIVDNNVKGVSVFMIDITSSKLREIQLTEAKEKAEKSDKLKTEFLAQISHEIRTPINNILNYIGLLIANCTKEKSDEVQIISESIESSSRRILRTIDLILNMSEVQLGSYNKIMKKIELINEVIKPIINEYNYTAAKKNISLKFISDCDKFNVHGDLYSLIQIFSNLLDNSIKYTNYGSVTISALLNERNEIQVSVSDTGIGISEDFLPNLFEPFRQEEQGYSRTYDGNGIGLALVKKYCDINDVVIEVKSVKSMGTTFILYFKNED